MNQTLMDNLLAERAKVSMQLAALDQTIAAFNIRGQNTAIAETATGKIKNNKTQAAKIKTRKAARALKNYPKHRLTSDARHEQITQLLQSKGRATVNDIAKAFHMSDNGVRRHTEIMFLHGMIERELGAGNEYTYYLPTKGAQVAFSGE